MERNKSVKRKTKVVLLCFFLPAEVLLCLFTLVGLFVFLPGGLVGLAASAFYCSLSSRFFNPSRARSL